MIGRIRHVTSPIWSRIDWLAGPKIRTVGQSLAELEIDKTVHLKLYLPLSGRSKHQLQWNISIYWDSRKINFNSMDQQSGRLFIWRFSWWVLLCRVYTFNEVVRIYEQGNKAFIDRIGRSVQGYIALSLFLIDLPSVYLAPNTRSYHHRLTFIKGFLGFFFHKFCKLWEHEIFACFLMIW